MNKKEFLIKHNIASHVASKAFGKLGLTAKRFTKAYANEYEDLSDEEHFIRKDFAKIVDGSVQKDQQGQLVMDGTKEKELVAALKAWKKEPIEFEFNNAKFQPVKLEGKDIFIAADIFEELNGFVFDVSEEDYLKAVEAEITKQN
jgi:phosphotransferase system HPr-like phosphotransfer protein